MRVIEHLMRSKVGLDLASCEDGWLVVQLPEVVNDRHPQQCCCSCACVIDGATSATGQTWTEKQWTSGKWATEILLDKLQHMTSTSTVASSSSSNNTNNLPSSPRALIDELTNAIHTAYQDEGVLEHMESHPEERATASIVLFLPAWNQVVMVGDCQACFVDHQGNILDDASSKVLQPTKYNDIVMAQARSMYLQIGLTQGQFTKEQLLQSTDDDPGRQFIEPLRKHQKVFQNNLDAPEPVRYWALDGFPIDESGIIVQQVPPTATQVILATDGYPQLFATLAETEAFLHKLIAHDPLLMGDGDDDDDDNNSYKYQSTKGVRLGNESFDDRTYLRIEL